MRYHELAFPAGMFLEARWDSYYRLGTSYVRPSELARRMRDETDPERGREARRLAALLKLDSGLPGAALAWKIGQNLRKELPWSCGPVALWLSGHFSSFIGLTATCRRGYASSSIFARLMGDAKSLRYIAPECAADPDPKIEMLFSLLTNLCTREGLAALRLGWEYPFSEEDIRREDELQRNNARDHWVLGDEEVADLETAWSTWRETRKPRGRWPHVLRLAFRLTSAPEFDAIERERIALWCLHNLRHHVTSSGAKWDILDRADRHAKLESIPFNDGKPPRSSGPPF